MAERRGDKKERAPRMVPCDGKGWRDGECLDCRREVAAWCALRNTPRVVEVGGGLVVVLRRRRRGGHRRRR